MNAQERFVQLLQGLANVDLLMKAFTITAIVDGARTMTLSFLRSERKAMICPRDPWSR